MAKLLAIKQTKTTIKKQMPKNRNTKTNKQMPKTY